MLAQQARLAGHALGKLGGVADRNAVGVEKALPDRADRERGYTFELLVAAVRQHPGRASQAVDVPAELDVIGEDQVGQRVAVAQELGALLDLVEVDADVLALDVADWDAVLVDDEVGRAVFALGGLVDGLDPGRADRLNQRFERRAIAVLRGPAGAELLAHGAHVGLEFAVHGRSFAGAGVGLASVGERSLREFRTLSRAPPSPPELTRGGAGA